MSEQQALNVENADTFGNYLIHGIDEIVLPPAISWWPAAPGWQLLGILILVGLAWLIVRRARHWRQNRYRRTALRKINQYSRSAGQRHAIAALPRLIKATALQAYPRHQVASLSGPDWLRFLDDRYDGPSFSEGLGEKLLSVAYMPEEQWRLDNEQGEALLQMARQWISSHRGAPND
ncbi:MAG: DUF4381 domain-containing protein [Gammaproteobacteria bacterium]|nr:DUF4381 domain-containing protein [Gammaproteobacteria bacterium]